MEASFFLWVSAFVGFSKFSTLGWINDAFRVQRTVSTVLCRVVHIVKQMT